MFENEIELKFVESNCRGTKNKNEIQMNSERSTLQGPKRMQLLFVNSSTEGTL